LRSEAGPWQKVQDPTRKSKGKGTGRRNSPEKTDFVFCSTIPSFPVSNAVPNMTLTDLAMLYSEYYFKPNHLNDLFLSVLLVLAFLMCCFEFK
jgi:hypothetical protein